jgi:hypothetical protein
MYTRRERETTPCSNTRGVQDYETRLGLGFENKNFTQRSARFDRKRCIVFPLDGLHRNVPVSSFSTAHRVL